jgi:hypothetical protein
MSSLCFNDALVKWRDGGIEEDEFIQSIVNHCAGARHGTNRLCNNDTATDKADYLAFGCNIDNDRFTAAMAEWIFTCFKNSPAKSM